MFDIFDAISFADDSYLGDSNESLNELLKNISIKSTNLALWFKASGLKVNEEKTECCVFHKNKKVKGSISVCDTQVSLSAKIKILGITFDQNLTWSDHISDLIPKLKKINGVFYHLKKFFSINECIKIATAIYYSKLYYACAVWLIPTLNNTLKNKLLSISALVLKNIFNRKCNLNDPISFLDLHKLAKRATPNMYMKYNTSITLHKIANNQVPESIWIDLNLQHINANRNYSPKFSKNNVHKIGVNNFVNRIQTVCNNFNHDFLSDSLNVHKKNSKRKFLSFNQ